MANSVSVRLRIRQTKPKGSKPARKVALKHFLTFVDMATLVNGRGCRNNARQAWKYKTYTVSQDYCPK